MMKKSLWIYGVLATLAIVGTGYFARLGSGTMDKPDENPQLASEATDSSAMPADKVAAIPPIESTLISSTHSHAADSDCTSCIQHAAHESGAGSPQEERPALKMTEAIQQELFNVGKNSPITFALPGDGTASGTVEMIRQEKGRTVMVQGPLTAPKKGRFFFQLQSMPGVAGSMVGVVVFDEGDVAYNVEPGADGQPELKEKHADDVFCRDFSAMPLPEDVPQEIPADHPDDIAIPDYQNGVIPLSSLPGAVAVAYLDFDGEEGPHQSWGDWDAAPANTGNANVRAIWERVAEDYAPFNINVTTDLQAYLAAPETSRIRCIITPTTTAQPGAGGVAFLQSFNWAGDTPCWVFSLWGKTCAEAASHEIGHTLKLFHDGRSTPAEEYYGGHGSGDVGWAPLMGVGYYKNLSQWSKGEYLNANRTQDDLAIIANDNNQTGYRPDDHADTLAAASFLEIRPDDSVSNEGIVETAVDSDGFRFTVLSSSTVSLTVSPVGQGPNLDMLAEIVDSTNGVVASDNPDTGINATVGATLGAGEYFLRVSGVGRGDVLGDGYSDYGSLGFYSVTGTVPNAVQPDRFTVAENSANTTSVGTVTPRNAHGVDPITFAIASGNGSGAFALSSSGELTVADSIQFDYEALSTYYDDLATLELFIDITNTNTPALNETVRVVVEVTNVNEAPSISGGGAITLLEHTQTGTELLTFSGSDSDHYDFPTFSITVGNIGTAFAIDATSGKLTVAADIDATLNPSYNLTITASDQGAPALTASTNVVVTVVDIAPGYTPGTISHAYYEGIGGSAVSDLTGASAFPHGPDYLTERTLIEVGSYGDNYGSVFRGFVIPPSTGSYTFWVSSDDASKLYLSTDANPANMTEIASVVDWTDYLNHWNKYPSQQSTPRTLTAGQPYYIEIRHKEGGGGDHVSAAWQGPGFSRAVIPGLYLAPYVPNYSPSIEAATHSIPENAFIGTAVATAVPSDPNPGDSHSQFTIIGGDSGNAFSIDAITGVITVTDTAQLAAGGSFNLQVQTTDDGTPVYSGSGTITINITTPTALMEGVLIQEVWAGIGGNTVALLTGHGNYPSSPSYTRTLSNFDSGANIADTYGSRIRAYVVPPTSGIYTFYIASDDHSQLLLSTDDNPANAAIVATVSTGDGWTGHNQWDKYSEQQATAVTLTAGQKYYIETLHKEGGGGDHISVGWSGPGITGTAVIDGAYLEGFSPNEAPIWDAAPYTFAADNSDPDGTAVGTVSATDGSADTLLYNILSGNDSGGFAMDPNTGAITIGNHLALSSGVHVLQVGVQDQGGAGTYPLATATTDVTVNVGGVNSPPVWNTSPIWESGVDGRVFSGTLLGEATDSNSDTIEYDKVSGNAWLTIAANGPLTGVPDTIGTNVFTVTADDGINPPVTNTLNIVVTAALPPAWLEDPIAGANGVISNAYSGTISGKAIDTNSDPISYSLVGSSTWLSVAANGGLSGTPETAGTHTFTVAVTDGIDGTNNATLNIYIAELPTVLVDNSTANGSFEAFTDDGDGKVMFVDGLIPFWTNWSEQDSADNDTGTDGYSAGTQNGLDGSRIAFLQPGGAILNMTSHVLQEGDVIDYSFWNSLVGRGEAVVSLVWDNNGNMGKITGTDVTAAAGTQGVGPAFTVQAGDAWIGKTLGLGIADGLIGDWAEVDQVFLSVTPVAVTRVPAENFGAVGSVADGSGLVLSWTGIPGLSYTVQTNADLVSGSWGPLTTGLSGNGTITVTNPITSDKLFYRIETE